MTVSYKMARSMFYALAALSFAGPAALCTAYFLTEGLASILWAVAFGLSIYLGVMGLHLSAYGLGSEWVEGIKARETAVQLGHKVDYFSLIQMTGVVTGFLGNVITAPCKDPVWLYQEPRMEIRHCPQNRRTQILAYLDGESPTEVFLYRGRIRVYRPGRWVEQLGALYEKAKEAAQRQAAYQKPEMFRSFQRDPEEAFSPVHDDKAYMV